MKLSLILSLLILSSGAFANRPLKKLFPVKQSIIAALMIHGNFKGEDDLEVQKAIDTAFSQIKILEDHGVEAALFEFSLGGILYPRINKTQMENMTTIMTEIVKRSHSVVIGVEILWHYPKKTLKLAVDSGSKFVRLDFFVDEMFADKKLVPIDPVSLMKYKKRIGGEDVYLFTDIQVKYALMKDTTKKMKTSATEAKHYGSDGVIVSGRKSGMPPSARRLKSARIDDKSFPVIQGSGFSYLNAEKLFPHVDAVIVGTSISTKTGGELVPAKVKKLMSRIIKLRSLSK
ncbi:MAG: hypothetical protein HOE90_19140 [Bacteriovoracaceae bacterium]|jgi:uncharacterized protein|nr:hypothetical protein [Bacteriovoracaceae bacterium]